MGCSFFVVAPAVLCGVGLSALNRVCRVVTRAIKQPVDCAAIKETLPPPSQSQLGWRRHSCFAPPIALMPLTLLNTTRKNSDYSLNNQLLLLKNGLFVKSFFETMPFLPIFRRFQTLWPSASTPCRAKCLFCKQKGEARKTPPLNLVLIVC